MNLAIRYSARFAISTVAAATSILGISASAATPTATLTPVMTGLNNPRHLAFDPFGNVYVAEAGTGGGKDAPSVLGSDGTTKYYGETGSISCLFFGKQRRIISGLPSLAAIDGSGAVGPSDVAVTADTLFATIGGGADPATRADLAKLDPIARDMDTLMAFPGGLDVPRKDWVVLSDFGSYETAYNPDGADVNSDPDGLALLPNLYNQLFPSFSSTPAFVVADAGGNDVFYVGSSGSLGEPIVIPTLAATIPGGPTIQAQSVPTSVAVAPLGGVYVGELTGYPFPQGGASVYHVIDGHGPEVEATGFTNIISMAFAPGGDLYVLDLTTTGGQGFPVNSGPGKIWRIHPSVSSGAGTPELVVGNLVFPTGIGVDPFGNLYVTTKGILPGVGEVDQVTFPGSK